MANGPVDTQSKAEKLLARLTETLENLVTLNVETVVTTVSVKVDDKGNWYLEPDPGAATNAMKSSIRLDQGDIQNAISAGALENEKLVSMHEQQVALSRQIVADNIKAVMELARSLAK